VRVMAGAVADPGLGFPRGQGDGHEGRTQVMRAHPLAPRRLLVKLRAANAHAPQVAPELLGQVLDVERDAVREHAVGLRRFGMVGRLPPLERREDVRPQVPVAGVVGLVRVEVDAASLQVHVAPP
jgi:hypothetical protein